MNLQNFSWRLFSCTFFILLVSGLSAQILPSRVAAADDKVVSEAIDAIERLPSSAVSEADIAIIDAAILGEDTPYRGRFFLLAGWLGRLDTLAKVPPAYRRSLSDQNNYDMAMLRAGAPAQVARLQKLLDQLEVDDKFVYGLGPALLYTKRREVVDFFFGEILVDQRNCTVADAHTAGSINCAYRLLEMIAPLLQNFPLQLRTSGDLATDDYPAALEIAREWIRNHRNDYLIVTETF